MYSGTLKLRNLGRARELHLFFRHSDGSSSDTITRGELFGLFELCAELPGVQEVNVELLAQLPQLRALLLFGFGELHVAEDEQACWSLVRSTRSLGALSMVFPGEFPLRFLPPSMYLAWAEPPSPWRNRRQCPCGTLEAQPQPSSSEA